AHARSQPRTAAYAPAWPPAGDPATASVAFPPQPLPILLAVPCAHLQIEVLRRSVESAQYTSIAFTGRLAAAGAQPSVGSVGDAYDNALAETVIGLYKTELIQPHGPWRTAGQVEAATLHYVDRPGCA